MNKRDRPALTSLSERALLRLLNGRAPADALPLAVVPRRVLVVKVHGMGDSVLIRSLIEHFHRRNPACQIGVLAGPATRDVLTMGSNFDLHEYNQGTLGLGAILSAFLAIRRNRYEAVLNFEQGSVAGTAFVRALGIPVHAGFLPLTSGHKAAMLTHPLRFRDTDSMWDSFVRLFRIVDADFPANLSAVPLPIDSGAIAWTKRWLIEHVRDSGMRTVVLHLGSGAGRTYRRWPVERFAELADRMRQRWPNMFVILTGQPHERPLIREFTARYRGPAADATGFGEIARTAALLSLCDLLVSNDTGVMHVGAAMGAPTVGIFGPAAPQRWAPIGPRAVAVYTGAACSPCAETYRGLDPPDCDNPDRMVCLRAISVEMVFAAVLKITARGDSEPRVLHGAA
jgi:ADP-heptose:LPS heptosyltransferase